MPIFSSDSKGNLFVDGEQTVFGKKSMPPTCEQAVGALKAAATIVRSKFAMLDEEGHLERYSICLECDLLSESGRCYKCGCFMKGKTRFKDMKCPIGKW